MKPTSFAESWLPYYCAKPRARLRLFCFPYAGAGASIYRSWVDMMPADIELCPIQLLGRESRLLYEPARHVTQIVQDVTIALQPYFDKPYAFFGHSMGALISFELARHLRRLYGTEPAYLFMSARPAPHLERTEPFRHTLSEDAFIEELRRLNGTSEEVLNNPELLSLVLPILRADFSVCETYTYQDEDPFNCPITVYGGLQDRPISRAALSAWTRQTRRAFTLRYCPGDHFFINTAKSLIIQTMLQDIFKHAFV